MATFALIDSGCHWGLSLGQRGCAFAAPRGDSSQLSVGATQIRCVPPSIVKLVLTRVQGNVVIRQETAESAFFPQHASIS